MKSSLRYEVRPLPVVQKEARKLLTATQLQEAITLAKRLRYYPNDHGLKYEPCGDGMELKIESSQTPNLKKQAWLRAIFWIDEKRKIIFIVDLFWKKENRIAKADLYRAQHRIQQLKKCWRLEQVFEQCLLGKQVRNGYAKGVGKFLQRLLLGEMLSGFDNGHIAAA